MTEKDLPERVRDARKARGMTQEEFARAAGVKYRAYQNFENRVSRPQPDNLRKILRAAGIDPGDAEAMRAPVNGDIRYFLDIVELWLINMDPSMRITAIRELTRWIMSGGDLSVLGIAPDHVAYG